MPININIQNDIRFLRRERKMPNRMCTRSDENESTMDCSVYTVSTENAQQNQEEQKFNKQCRSIT